MNTDRESFFGYSPVSYLIRDKSALIGGNFAVVSGSRRSRLILLIDADCQCDIPRHCPPAARCRLSCLLLRNSVGTKAVIIFSPAAQGAVA
jgi:hypothetical protein